MSPGRTRRTSRWTRRTARSIVYPPTSFLAEPPVAVVDANVKRKGTGAVAKAYLDFVFSDAGQRIIAAHHYRPIEPVPDEPTFPALERFPITAIAKDWDDAVARFFADGALFDRIYGPGERTP